MLFHRGLGIRPMSEISFNTSFLQDRLERWRSGDRAAADDLIRKVIARLVKLARRMFKTFPNIHGIAEIDDVIQGSLMRLLRTLRRLIPKGTRDFINLAAVHIRRELLDLARHCKAKGFRQLHSNSDGGTPLPDLISEADTSDFDLWVLFHENVDQLPLEEREVVGLIFYHGWTQREIAELFKVDERTIRRRWASARQKLQSMIGKDLFEN